MKRGDDSSDDEQPNQWGSNFSYQNIATAPFKSLYKSSPIVQLALEFGSHSIPLPVVGMLLNYAGNHILHYIYAIHNKRIFYPSHWVVSIQLESNGDVVTTAIEKKVSINLDLNYKPHENQPGFRLEEHSEKEIVFRSKAIILSNGGAQALHPQFFTWFRVLSNRPQDVILSD